MQRSALLRCIVSNCVVYAKKADTLRGICFFATGPDSNNLNATVRWTVAATSANTGCYLNFRRGRKCKRFPTGHQIPVYRAVQIIESTL